MNMQAKNSSLGKILHILNIIRAQQKLASFLHKTYQNSKGSNGMNETKKVRILLLMMLIMSGVCSMALGLMAYTVVTGELPYDINSYYLFRDETYAGREKEMKAADLPISQGTIDEITLRKLHEELQKKGDALKADEERVSQNKDLVEQLVQQSTAIKTKTEEILENIRKEKESQKNDYEKMNSDLDAKRKDFEDRMSYVDTKIVEKIAATLASMKPQTAMLILNDLEIAESSRMLNKMDKEKQASILSQMIEATEINGVKLSQIDKVSFRRKANEIIAELRKLKENMGENP
jgi:flagellar motility protein MotE (MotC chaperone)